MLKRVIVIVLMSISLAAESSGTAVSIDESVLSVPTHTMENLGLSLVKPGERIEVLSDGDRELCLTAVNALLSIYQSMNRNIVDRNRSCVRSDYKIPGTLWQSIHENEDHLTPVFDCSLTNALNEVRNATSPFLIDCTIAAEIAKYALVEVLLPEMKDNIIKSSCIKTKQKKLEEQNRFFSDTTIVSGFLMAIFCDSEVVEGVENIKPGDFVYIHGHPNYVERHPFGISRGENLFLVGYNAEGLKMYIGYGNLFKNGPKTAKEIQEYLTERYLLGNANGDFAKTYGEIRKVRPFSARLDITAIQERRT